MQQHQIKEKDECVDSESETDESDLDFMDVESDDYVRVLYINYNNYYCLYSTLNSVRFGWMM